MIYLAGPYSHEDFLVRNLRFLALNKAAVHLINQGHLVFSPISHGHPIAMEGDLPTNWEYWEAYCKKMISVCDKLYVLTIEGWDKSRGVAEEIKIAQKLNLEVNLISITSNGFSIEPHISQ